MLLGTNVGHSSKYKPNRIADLGLNIARIVLTPERIHNDYLNDARNCSVELLGVIARESLGTMTPLQAAEFYVAQYPTLKYWQIGNESDHVSDSSWTQSKAELNELLDVFVSTIRLKIPHAKIYGPGLVSGQPDYLDGVNLDGLDAICVHPYAQWPDTVGNLLNGYRRFEKPILITEFGWPEPDWKAQGEWFESMLYAMRDAGVIGMINYCWDDEQNPHFGLVSEGLRKPAATAFKRFALETREIADPNPDSNPEPLPEPTHEFKFDLGFLEAYNSNPVLVGEPLENEFGGIPGASQQLTTRGMLSWMNLKEGSEILFYEFDRKRRYRWVSDHLEPLN
jgi:hypothetical protein